MPDPGAYRLGDSPEVTWHHGRMSTSVARVRRPRLVGAIGVVMAVVFGFMAFATYQDVTRLRDHGVETTARVVSVDGQGRWTQITVEFTPAGSREPVRTGTRDVFRSPAPSSGDRLKVVYDPADPTRVADVRARPGIDVPLFGLVMTLLWVGLAFFAFTGRLGRLRSRGESVAE